MQIVLHLHRLYGDDDLARFDLIAGLDVDLLHDAGHRRCEHPLAGVGRRLHLRWPAGAPAAAGLSVRDRIEAGADDDVVSVRSLLGEDIVWLPVKQQ